MMGKTFGSLHRRTEGQVWVQSLILVGLVALAGIGAYRAFGSSISKKASEEGQHVRDLTGMSGGPGSTGGPICTSGSCTGGSMCFAAGTPVATPAGPRPIEDIKAGDVVLSYRQESGDFLPSRVVATFVTPERDLVEVHVHGDPAPLRVTPGHPFLTFDRGWVRSESLEAGEPLLDADGTAVLVDSVVPASHRDTVYNFEVESTHTYFVGDHRVLVHNPNPITNPQGPATQPTIVTGHAVHWPSDGMTTVPPGTWVEWSTWYGGATDVAYGHSIETGGDLSQHPESQGAHLYPSGAQMPNITVYPPDHAPGGSSQANAWGEAVPFTPANHPDYGAPLTVTQPTPISSILHPGMGPVVLSMCHVNGCFVGGPLYGVPSYPPAGAQPIGYPPLPSNTHYTWPTQPNGNPAPAVHPPGGSAAYPKPPLMGQGPSNWQGYPARPPPPPAPRGPSPSSGGATAGSCG